MRKFKLITTLRFLEVSELIDGCFTLMPGIDVINDRNRIEEILNDEFLGIAGTIEASHLLNANHILFCETDERVFSNKHGSNEALAVWLVWLDMLISDSWLIKDRGFNFEVQRLT